MSDFSEKEEAFISMRSMASYLNKTAKLEGRKRVDIFKLVLQIDKLTPQMCCFLGYSSLRENRGLDEFTACFQMAQASFEYVTVLNEAIPGSACEVFVKNYRNFGYNFYDFKQCCKLFGMAGVAWYRDNYQLQDFDEFYEKKKFEYFPQIFSSAKRGCLTMSKKKLRQGNLNDGSAFQRSTEFQADLEKFIKAVKLRSNSKKFSCLFEFPALCLSINAQARKWTDSVSGPAVRKKLCAYSKKEAKNGRV